MERPKRREVRREPLAAELEQPDRRVDVLEPVVAEVDERDVGAKEVTRRARDDDLPAVADGRDTRGVMDVQTDVALAAQVRFARMDAHANADGLVVRPRLCGKRALGVGRGLDRACRRREREKERVALRVDLGAVVPSDGLTEDEAMKLQRVAVRGSEPPEQVGGALDVREEQRDGAGREAACRGRRHDASPGGPDAYSCPRPSDRLIFSSAVRTSTRNDFGVHRAPGRDSRGRSPCSCRQRVRTPL